ncbi:MAG: hypothetical protein O3A00_02170 [Planctomycetota bacterium]|nr:hypothetical protein [Planctomycetota bacterium]
MKLANVSIAILCLSVIAPLNAADTLYSPPRPADVLSKMLQWVAAQKGADKALQEKVGEIWGSVTAETPPDEVLATLVEVFGVVDPAARKLTTDCKFIDAGYLAPKAELLDSDQADPFFRHNMALYYGRYLAQRNMFDEALEVLAPLDPAKVVDPATCLFFKAVCQHQLLDKPAALATIDSLLKNTEAVPARYATVADLMKYELQGIQPKSLDEISKRMSDVERRLDLGRAGQRVQKEEKRIVALLDEMIEKIEQSQGGGGGGTGGSQNQSSSPAGDSSVKGSAAPGQVDDKDLGPKPTEIGLQEQEEARARQSITRDFPSRYKIAGQEYFKKLAKRKKNSSR